MGVVMCTCTTKTMAAEVVLDVSEDATASADAGTNSSTSLFSSHSQEAILPSLQGQDGDKGVVFPAGQDACCSHVIEGDTTTDQEVLQDLLELAGERPLEFGDLKEQSSPYESPCEVVQDSDQDMEFEQSREGGEGEGGGEGGGGGGGGGGVEQLVDDLPEQQQQSFVRYEYHQSSQPQLIAGSWCEEFSKHRENYFKGCKW